MEVTITKTVTEKVDTTKLRVSNMGEKDVDSIKLDVYYDDAYIGYGHLNTRSDLAFIYLEEGCSVELKDWLENAIEERTIEIN